MSHVSPLPAAPRRAICKGAGGDTVVEEEGGPPVCRIIHVHDIPATASSVCHSPHVPGLPVGGSRRHQPWKAVPETPSFHKLGGWPLLYPSTPQGVSCFLPFLTLIGGGSLCASLSVLLIGLSYITGAVCPDRALLIPLPTFPLFPGGHMSIARRTP